MLKAAPSTAYGCSPSTRPAIPRAARWRPFGGSTPSELRDRSPASPYACHRADGGTRRLDGRAGGGPIPSRRGASNVARPTQLAERVAECLRRYRVDGLRGPAPRRPLQVFGCRRPGARRPGPSVPSFAYLTLGERGAGPRAPSDLDWVLEGNRVRLSWKDNSSDELGFEVQVDGERVRSGEFRWRRLLTVPADTESAVSDMPLLFDRPNTASGSSPTTTAGTPGRRRPAVPAGRMRRRSACRTRASW